MEKTNKVPLAIVTGAAHRLGRDLAISLARLGFAIVLHCYESREEAIGAKEEILSLGVRAEVIQSDLRVPAEIDRLFQAVDSFDCQLHVLVNSAAVMNSEDLLAVDVDDFDSDISLNLRAPLLCAQHAASRMDTGGLIVNISDVGANKTWTGYPVYVMSKAGLESLTRLLARALAPEIRVNAIAPGFVYQSKNLSQEEWERLLAKVPMRRSARPEEIVSTLEFLLKNEYVTGQTIIVDGGYSLV
jgi:NAD(P)-dependent dehydrogenase (short-subunit alcohol dehydrogenase family)